MEKLRNEVVASLLEANGGYLACEREYLHDFWGNLETTDALAHAQEINKLVEFAEYLAENASSADNGETRGRETRGRKPGTKNAKPEKVDRKVLNLLQNRSKGLPFSRICAQVDYTDCQVRSSLNRLRESGSAHFTGNKRSAVWHASENTAR